MSCSGTHQLKCECGAKYIRKTSRKFKRYQEHIHSFIYNIPEKSKFATYLLDTHHPLSPHCFNIVKIVDSLIPGNNWKYLKHINLHVFPVKVD